MIKQEPTDTSKKDKIHSFMSKPYEELIEHQSTLQIKLKELGVYDTEGTVIDENPLSHVKTSNSHWDYVLKEMVSDIFSVYYIPLMA